MLRKNNLRLIYLLLFSLSGSILFAQTGDLPVFNTDPPNQTYQNIYQDWKNNLSNLGYPVGRAGKSAYVTDQFVVMYEAGQLANVATDSTTLANKYGADFQQVKRCGCGATFEVRLYQIDSLGGNERGKGGSNDVAKGIGREDDGVSPNYYLAPRMPNGPVFPPVFNNLPAGYSPNGNPNGGEITIAVLDSGIDHTLENHSINGQGQLYFWNNPNEPVVNGVDNGNDPFCFVDDVIGWDFVNNDNNPADDNSHGTHVAGIIARQLTNNAPGLNYELMPLKILDQNGVGNTFDAMCAVLYAAYHGADIINASWGYYGEADYQLERAFKRAHQAGVLTVTSAGNDRVDLTDIAHYPAEFGMRDSATIRSIVFSGGLQNNPLQLWTGTNFRTTGPSQNGFVAGPADEITSLVPSFTHPSNLQEKSGTSMATPFLTALAADYRRFRPQDRPRVVRYNLLYLIRQSAPLLQFISDGAVYPYYSYFWFDIPTLYNQYQPMMMTN